jgi:ABC-type polar amino acid transport system ATPase subunit
MTPATDAAAVLEVQRLLVRRGGQILVSDASFSVLPGEIVALMGPSGSGKTTILRAVAGLDPIDDGRVRVGGLPVHIPRARRSPRGLHRQVGMVFQFHHLFDHLNVLDNVCLAPMHVLGVTRSDAERRALELLSMVGVDRRTAAFPHELSGGEAQRVAIARALAVNPPLLLLDEPTASLDEVRRDHLAGILRRLTSNGRAVLLSTHDAPFARSCADRVLAIDGGRVAEGAAASSL